MKIRLTTQYLSRAKPYGDELQIFKIFRIFKTPLLKKTPTTLNLSISNGLDHYRTMILTVTGSLGQPGHSPTLPQLMVVEFFWWKSMYCTVQNNWSERSACDQLSNLGRPLFLVINLSFLFFFFSSFLTAVIFFALRGYRRVSKFCMVS